MYWVANDNDCTVDTPIGLKQYNLNKEIIARIVRNHRSKFLATDYIL
jgi:hypothetical protein